MRQHVDVVELKETGTGYEFEWSGVAYCVRFESGAWRLAGGGEDGLFESFNEAMHHALDFRAR